MPALLGLVVSMTEGGGAARRVRGWVVAGWPLALVAAVQVISFKFFMPSLVSGVSVALGEPDPHMVVGWGDAVWTTLAVLVGLAFIFLAPVLLGLGAGRVARWLGRDEGAWEEAGLRVGMLMVVAVAIIAAWWR